MPKYILSISLVTLFVVLFALSVDSRAFAQTASSSAGTSSQEDIRNRIKDLENKIADIKGEEKSLSSQIAVMSSQTKLTQLRIEETKQQINDLEASIEVANNKIDKLEGTLDEVTKIILNRVRETYIAGDIKPIQLILSSSNATDLITKEQYLKMMAVHDQELLFETQQAKNDYANQKQIFQDKEKKMTALKVQLEDYTKELAVEEANKKQLLSQTQGSEANYQRLLSQARAQLAGFSRFTQSQGGAGLLSGQTTCDDWGCYYNQRDSQWGGQALNGTQYTLASDGCLVTAMAMVLTHYGHKTLPSEINANPDNFASYYPAYLLYTIRVNSVSASRIGSSIDSALSNGDPVIVGLNANGGTHFVVLRSGSGGSYMMNDPYVANGNNIPFTDHYSVGSIFEIDKVVIQ